MARISWSRLLGATAAAYVVAIASLSLLFGQPSIERILFASEAGQSHKVLSVWLQQDPLPAITPLWDQLADVDGRGFAVQGLIVLWAFALAVMYAFGWVYRPRPTWSKGATFGLAIWAILFLFFKAYLPFNVLGEPFRVVLQLRASLLRDGPAHATQLPCILPSHCAERRCTPE